jgi:homoserine dehydrogenase
MTQFDLLLVGNGNVARRFVSLLEERRGVLGRRYAIRARVVGVKTRRSSAESTVDFIRAACARHAAAARERRLVVVETTTLDVAKGEPATSHVRAALAGRAHVITTNKGPTAFAYRSLRRAAERAGRKFLFEGAVMDGIPIFNLVRDALPAVTIIGFRGVVNSTTNYVLTAMERGETFDGALAAMQRSGIAEADASLDIEGWDAAAKTAVLANVLLGARVTPHSVDREGVNAAAAHRILAAQAVGRRVKLVASAEKAGGVVRGRVLLVDLPETDLLAGLDGQENALILHTDLLGEVAIVQRGSGLTPTAYGLVADLVSILRDVQRTRASRRSPGPARRDRNP